MLHFARLAVPLAFSLLLCAASPAGGSPAAGGARIEWNLSSNEIGSSCLAAIETARTAVRVLAASRKRSTVPTTLLPLENLNANLTDRLVVQAFLWEVSPDKAVRAASLACSNAVSNFAAEALANPDIYRRLRALPASSLHSDADRALLKLWLQGYELSGAGLPNKQRAEFVALSKRLTVVQNDFQKNVNGDTTAIEVTKDELDGLPADFVASLKTSADGKLLLPANASTLQIVLPNARNGDLRRREYLAGTNVQFPANAQLLSEALHLRYRLAHLLGFPNWAAYQMANRTVTDPHQIDAFLADLDGHVRGAAAQEIATLQALKDRDSSSVSGPVEFWDVPYYVAQLQKTRYAVDRNEVRQYFPAPHVVSAVLEIYQRLLGIHFTPVVPTKAWAPDVTEYAVSDAATGRYIGSFFLDLYPREGKTNGAYNRPLLQARVGPDGKPRPPLAALIVGDWPPALNGKPALLSHDDVTVFFHEFGHCMAALLTTVPYESLASFGQDFIEAPSQMLENFTWDPTILKKLSSNVDTGAPIPDELVKQLVAARCTSDRICNAYAATRQIMYSDIDLRYHEGSPDIDLSATWDGVARRDTPVPPAPGAHSVAQFAHLVSGYDAGYYVYLWSLVYAQDMFTAFQKGGIENPDVGMRYRRTILEPAYTYSADKEVQDFLGRPMSRDAFYAGFGISN